MCMPPRFGGIGAGFDGIDRGGTPADSFEAERATAGTNINNPPVVAPRAKPIKYLLLEAIGQRPGAKTGWRRQAALQLPTIMRMARSARYCRRHK